MLSLVGLLGSSWGLGPCSVSFRDVDSLKRRARRTFAVLLLSAQGSSQDSPSGNCCCLPVRGHAPKWQDHLDAPLPQAAAVESFLGELWAARAGVLEMSWESHPAIEEGNAVCRLVLHPVAAPYHAGSSSSCLSACYTEMVEG